MLDIVALQNIYGANMSTIRDKVRLNYKTATSYLMLAHDNGYIKHENGIFITTDKGKVFIELAHEIRSDLFEIQKEQQL